MFRAMSQDNDGAVIAFIGQKFGVAMAKPVLYTQSTIV